MDMMEMPTVDTLILFQALLAQQEGAEVTLTCNPISLSICGIEQLKIFSRDCTFWV